MSHRAGHIHDLLVHCTRVYVCDRIMSKYCNGCDLQTVLPCEAIAERVCSPCEVIPEASGLLIGSPTSLRTRELRGTPETEGTFRLQRDIEPEGAIGDFEADAETDETDEVDSRSPKEGDLRPKRV